MLYVKVMVSERQSIFLKMYSHLALLQAVLTPSEQRRYSLGGLESTTNRFLFSFLFVLFTFVVS